MYQIPRMLFSQGLVVFQSCRRIFLGGMIDLNPVKKRKISHDTKRC